MQRTSYNKNPPVIHNQNLNIVFPFKTSLKRCVLFSLTMTITATSRIPTNENAMGISILYGSSCPSSNGSNSADVL